MKSLVVALNLFIVKAANVEDLVIEQRFEEYFGMVVNLRPKIALNVQILRTNISDVEKRFVPIPPALKSFSFFLLQVEIRRVGNAYERIVKSSRERFGNPSVPLCLWRFP